MLKSSPRIEPLIDDTFVENWKALLEEREFDASLLCFLAQYAAEAPLIDPIDPVKIESTSRIENEFVRTLNYSQRRRFLRCQTKGSLALSKEVIPFVNAGF